MFNFLLNANEFMHSISDFVYRTLISAVRHLEEELAFTSHDKFGWLTMCPANIGTTLNCHVRMKLNKPADYLKEIGEQFHVVLTDVMGVECAENECIIDISNERVFGLSEFDCMKMVYYGVKEIIRRNARESQTAAVAEEEVPATTCDEPQAEMSLNSVQSNGTYTKEQVEDESVAASGEHAVEAENTRTPIQADDEEEDEQSVIPKEAPSADKVEDAGENSELNEEVQSTEN